MDGPKGRCKILAIVVTKLKSRGVADIFIACVDEVKDFLKAIKTVFTETSVQVHLVRMVRHRLNFVG